jgi:hypothetical protein
VRSLGLTLTKDKWNDLLSYFKVLGDLSATQAQNIRRLIMMAPERKDFMHRALYSLPAAWRASTIKFRENGILLPFSAPRRQFDTPNPYARSSPNSAVEDTAAD